MNDFNQALTIDENLQSALIGKADCLAINKSKCSEVSAAINLYTKAWENNKNNLESKLSLIFYE